MAYNVTLGELLFDLRAELGESTNPANTKANRDMYVRVLQRNQRKFWMEFDWPHLLVKRYVPVRNTERYYDFPDDIDEERAVKLSFKYNTVYFPLAFGINERELNARDSDRNEQNLPCTKWDYFHEDGANKIQYELWPVPNVDGFLYAPNPQLPAAEAQVPNRNPDGDYFVRIEGIRKLRPFSEDDDVCDIDGELLVLASAAEIAARKKTLDADAKAAIAGQYLNKLKSRYIQSDSFKMGTDLRKTSKFKPQTSNDVRFLWGPRRT